MIEIILNKDGTCSKKWVDIGFSGENLDKTLHFTYPEEFKSYHKYVLCKLKLDENLHVLPISDDDTFVISTVLTSKECSWMLQVMFRENVLDLSAEYVDISTKEGEHVKLFDPFICEINKGLYSGEAINTFEQDENVQLFYEKLLKVVSENSGGSGVTSWNDLEDRPFYEEAELIAKADSITLTYDELGLRAPFDLGVLEIGATYRITLNNTEYYGTAGGNQSYGIYLIKNATSSHNFYCVTYEDGYLYYSAPLEAYTCSVEVSKITLVQLDEKFIPDTIARKDLLEPLHVSLTRADDGTYSANKTWDEINSAYEEGKEIQCNLTTNDGTYVDEIALDTFTADSQALFKKVIFDGNYNRQVCATIKSDDTVIVTNNQFRYQTTSDTLLNTEAKTIVGAINELKDIIDAVKATAVTVSYKEEDETIDFEYVANVLANNTEETEES